MGISPAQDDWVSSSCTLPTAERPMRVAEFDRFFAASGRAIRRPGPARLEVVVDPAAEGVARELAERETGCCSFFTFEFATAAEGLVMSVGVPPAHLGVLEAFAARAESAIGAGR